MKRLLILVGLLFIGLTSFAQVKVENTVPYFDVQFKRAFVKGTTLYVDLLFENTCAYDTFIQVDPGAIIDDEGNRYAKWYTENNKGSQYQLTIPAGITQKLRFVIKNLDEYAASFQVIDFDCFIANKLDPDWHGGARGQVRLRNVPVNRENQ